MDLYIYLALGIIVVLIVLVLLLFRKVNILSARFLSFMRGKNGASLEDRLIEICSHVDNVKTEVADNRIHLKEIANVLNTATRGIGVVRFNAFQDTGGDLSFSIAFLDAYKNGLVLSSIYGRDESRSYAKPLRDGQSQYQLSREEKEAIHQAAESLLKLTDH